MTSFASGRTASSLRERIENAERVLALLDAADGIERSGPAPSSETSPRSSSSLAVRFGRKALAFDAVAADRRLDLRRSPRRRSRHSALTVSHASASRIERACRDARSARRRNRRCDARCARRSPMRPRCLNVSQRVARNAVLRMINIEAAIPGTREMRDIFGDRAARSSRMFRAARARRGTRAPRTWACGRSLRPSRPGHAARPRGRARSAPRRAASHARRRRADWWSAASMAMRRGRFIWRSLRRGRAQGAGRAGSRGCTARRPLETSATSAPAFEPRR